MSNLSIVLGKTDLDLLKNETLPDLFRRSAQQFPSKIALTCGNDTVTYQDLDTWSNAIAADLISKGVLPGASVGVWWPRGLALHAAILGISKAGAAYVPLDYEMPEDRVLTVLKEVGASAYVSPKFLELAVPRIQVLDIKEYPQQMTFSHHAQADHWAYVLYTSGSTGKPKGIPITHRQICHLVRSEQSVLGVNSEDRVYQGFSVSFDMWCEETWMSYLVGASLWVADAILAKSVDELSAYLQKNQITVLHAVPSLLAVMDDNIPSLRLVNAGGEACTPQVLERWAHPTRLFFNTYGPTETTVTATIARLQKGDSITIGEALPNYSLAVVDENLNPLPCGEKGELVISGPGVGEGYVNRPELTREKFLPKPKSLESMTGDRIYKTGDAASISSEGIISVQGRFDDQIKLRGYRIELGEIESQLNQLPGVSAAAVAVKKDKHEQDHLVGYLLCEKSTNFNLNEARSELAKHLPVYMVPSVLTILSEMPRLPSGKIDRKSLPIPEELNLIALDPEEESLDPHAPIHDRVLAVLHQVFPGRPIDVKQDFFNDLGGHSLLAAEFVSRLRTHAGLPHASIKDVYLFRPLSVLIDQWSLSQKTEEVVSERKFRRVSRLKHLACGIAQSFALLLIYGLFAVEIFLPYLAYYYVQQETESHAWGIVTALISFTLIPPVFTALTIFGKWLVVGKAKEGDYPLWGFYYFRWWFAKSLQKLTPIEYMNGTPLFAFYLRLMGMKIAPDAQLSMFNVGASDLVSIGKNVSISSNVVLNNAFVEEGLLKLRKIEIENHAYLGSSAIVNGGCKIEEWGELKDLSSLPPNTTLPAKEVWQGSPAVKEKTKSDAELLQPLEVSKGRRFKYSLIYVMLLLIFPFTLLLPLLPTLIVLNELDTAAPPYNFNYLVLAPLFALTYVILFALESVVLTRILHSGLKPGNYPVFSKFYLRKWFADQITNVALFVLHPAYATVYVSTLYRALGAKIGKNSEISTASQVTHRLLEIGDGAFIADAVTLGEDEIRGQQLSLTRTHIGNNSFVGNSALIPQGYQLPDNMLIGVLSVPPTEEQLQSGEAKNWFGSPSIALPRRQESASFPASLTMYPSHKRRVVRGLIEGFRILVPTAAMISFSVLFIALVHDLIWDENHWKIICLFPLYYLTFVGFPAFLITVFFKWLLVGKYKPCQVPMWTWKVWRSEAVTAIYESLAAPFFLEYLKGTPWLSLALRLFGVKTGKRVWMNTADITEFDMVEIGDDSALNDDCGPQTHLFEDRVMKMGSVKVGKRCTVGTRTVILYDTVIDNDVNIASLSLVMKGENLPSKTQWEGSPVKPV